MNNGQQSAPQSTILNEINQTKGHYIWFHDDGKLQLFLRLTERFFCIEIERPSKGLAAHIQSRLLTWVRDGREMEYLPWLMALNLRVIGIILNELNDEFMPRWQSHGQRKRDQNSSWWLRSRMQHRALDQAPEGWVKHSEYKMQAAEWPKSKLCSSAAKTFGQSVEPQKTEISLGLHEWRGEFSLGIRMFGPARRTLVRPEGQDMPWYGKRWINYCLGPKYHFHFDTCLFCRNPLQRQKVDNRILIYCPWDSGPTSGPLLTKLNRLNIVVWSAVSPIQIIWIRWQCVCSFVWRNVLWTLYEPAKTGKILQWVGKFMATLNLFPGQK
jgi:hypothetical protein